jgi:hypothetical protein
VKLLGLEFQLDLQKLADLENQLLNKLVAEVKT